MSTSIRKGNFNYATTNVPVGESLRGEALLMSLYLTCKPDWGSTRWPAFGPDLNRPIGTIPAQARWNQMQR